MVFMGSRGLAVSLTTQIGALSVIGLCACVASACKKPSMIASGSAASGVGRGGTALISLYGINDFHGHAESTEVSAGSEKIKVGGLDAVKAYFDISRKVNPNSLFFSSGDLFQGTLVSDWFKGEAMIDPVNQIGFDAATFGNHEFDYGLKRLQEIMSRTKIPYLTANILQGGKLPFAGTAKNISASKIFQIDGVKIGVMGVTTVTTPKETKPENVTGLVFNELKDSVVSEAKNLKKKGAQVVVLLSHAGGACKAETEPTDEAACQAVPPDELTGLLRALPQNTIDVVFAAHTHMFQGHFINGVAVVQTEGGNGLSMDHVTLKVNRSSLPSDSRTHRISEIEIGSPIYFCHQTFEKYNSCNPNVIKKYTENGTDLGKVVQAQYLDNPVKPDSSIMDSIQKAKDELQPILAQSVANLPVELTNDRSKESPASNCVVDVAREYFSQTEGKKADIMVVNSGGIRRGMPAGKLTLGTVFEVLPFDNPLLLAELTGQELNRLGLSLSREPKNIAVVSAGWQVSLKSQGFPRHITFVTPKGHPVSDTEKYQVLAPSFLADVNPDVFMRAEAEKGVVKYNKVLRDYFVEGLRAASSANTLPPSCRFAGIEKPRMVFK